MGRLPCQRVRGGCAISGGRGGGLPFNRFFLMEPTTPMVQGVLCQPWMNVVKAELVLHRKVPRSDTISPSLAPKFDRQGYRNPNRGFDLQVHN